MATVLPEMETIQNIRTLQSRVTGTDKNTGLPELIRKAVSQGAKIPDQLISDAAIDELLRKGQLTQSSADLLRNYTGDADPTVTGSTLSGGDPVTTEKQVSGDPSLSKALTGQETPTGTTVEAVGSAASPGTTADITGDSGDRQVGPGADIDVVGDGQTGGGSGGEVAVTSDGSNRGNLVVIALLLGGAALVWGWLYG